MVHGECKRPLETFGHDFLIRSPAEVFLLFLAFSLVFWTFALTGMYESSVSCLLNITMHRSPVCS